MPLRRVVLAFFVGAVLVAMAPDQVSAQEEFPDSLWNYVQTPWLNFVFGLAVMMDVSSYRQDRESEIEFGDLNVGRAGEIRALRGLFSGQVSVLGRSYEYLFAATYRGFDEGFKQENGNSVSVLDLAVRVPLWSGAHVNIGKQKEPFSHDRVQSMLFNPSHERPAHVDALTRSRNTGLLFERWNREARWKWALGYYNDWLDPGTQSFTNNPQSAIGRITGLVIDHEAVDGPILHLGASFNKTWVPVAEEVSIKAKPEAFFAPAFVDTESFLWEGGRAIGVEAAFIEGPLNLSGEVIRMSIDAPTVDDPAVWGWHAQMGWTLTGERRSYDRRWGVVSTVSPDVTTGEGGMGAWQLAFRYSYLDADSGLLEGGVMDRYSSNLQWYLSRFNFITLHVGFADLTRRGVHSGTWIGLIRWGILTR